MSFLPAEIALLKKHIFEKGTLASRYLVEHLPSHGARAEHKKVRPWARLGLWSLELSHRHARGPSLRGAPPQFPDDREGLSYLCGHFEVKVKTLRQLQRNHEKK